MNSQSSVIPDSGINRNAFAAREKYARNVLPQEYNREPKKQEKIHPITSYGIILFCMVGGEPKFLIYQRRDNYEYIDILRGNWGNEKRLRELFAALTQHEKERLLNYTFEELWDDLWVTGNNKIHKEGFSRAKKRFESIKNKIPEIISETLNYEKLETPWGFPKGKANPGESGKETALREFGEETGLPTDNIVFWGINHFSEYYKGNNNKPYCTHYYLAEIDSPLPVTRISTPGCIREDAVSDEAEDARWATIEEASLKLVSRRASLLKKIHHIIKTSYNKYSLFGEDQLPDL